ncbi:hypothetical protein DFH27DRAFT_608075 [Peziza echinospora]|nr:hypothetical protein DFH27DRAFT_608075 [Peziza echinospora]
MANLGILMSAITRDVCSAAVIDMNFVRGHSENLKRWHDNLPHCLKLSEALGFQSNSSHRTSILLTHTAYLSSLILLTRRILVAHTRSLCPQGYINTVVNTAEDELLKLSHDCVYAARQLATVVSILFNEGRLVRRCWLGIQAAFTSCLVIFLELAVSIRDGGAALQQADVELASRCMYVLEYCAAADMIARSYLSAVVPIRNALFAISAAPPASPRIPPPQHIGSPPACVSPPALASPQAQGVPVGSGGYLSIDNVVTHVLEWLETPYGGESRIISEMPPNAPEHWRFLNASPPQLPTLGNTPHHSPYHGAQSPVSYGYLNDSRQSSPQPLPNSPQLKGIHGSPTPSHPSSPTHHSGKNPVLYRLQRTPSRYSTDPTSVACPGGPLPDVKMREPGSVNGSGRRKMPFKTMEEYEQFLKRVV